MKAKKIVIVDYNLGNLFSVKHACDYFGASTIITSDKKEILGADGIILPGVGAFGEAMDNLDKMDLIIPLKEFIQSKKPFLGVCLGMQLLFNESEEFGNHQGLGIIDGVIRKFPASTEKMNSLKIPQIAWNQIFQTENGQSKWEISPLRDQMDGEYMYFVHSFYALPEDKEDILSLTNYEDFEYCSSIMKDNVYATQFHPEKSGKMGIQIYKNWIKLINQNNS